jgi:small Trp-rich protein
MWLVGVGLVLLVLKLADVMVVGSLSWWVVLSPFGLAALWWAFADYTGVTQRRVMADQDERARKRREQQYEALGMRAPRPGGSGATGRRDKPRD